MAGRGNSTYRGESVFFSVRYGRTVVFITATVIVLLFAIGAIGLYTNLGSPFTLSMMTGLPFAILAFTFPFTVRGYLVRTDTVDVVRLVGRKRIAERVTRVVADDVALKGALRVFGNGGLFSINGWFRLRGRGICRLWVTDLHNLVVIESRLRTAVVSPLDRTGFVARFHNAGGTGG